MTRLFFVAALLALAACESDEKKLKRLHIAEATACLPVLRADSAEQAYAAALGRIQDGARGGSPYGAGASAIAMAQADLDEAKRRVAKLSADMDQEKTHPKQYAEQQKAAQDEQIKCELAKRDLSRFMGGK